ncbi:DUF5723 family protein [Calditrichota bacterium]
MPLLTGRYLALAGADPLGMYGTNAIGANPSNLLSPHNPDKMVLLPSIGLSIGNNTFSQAYIADTFVEGDTLTNDDKKDILDRIDVNDLILNGNVTIPGFGYSENQYSFNFASLYIHSNISLPTDLFRLPLNGWETDRVYSFDDIEAELMAYWAVSFSMARSLPEIEYVENFTAGVTFSYYIGVRYFELGQHRGFWNVTADSINTSGHFQLVSSNSGDGVGLDLGISGDILDGSTTVGMTFGNIIGSVNWQQVEINDIQFSRNRALDLDSLIRADYWKSFFHDQDTTFHLGSYTTTLPKYLLFAARHHGILGEEMLDLSVSLRQGLNRAPGNSFIPRLAFGGELRPQSNYPLRAGISFGGLEGVEIAGGFGLNFGNYRIDIGGSWQRGIMLGAKGFAFSLTNQLILPVDI